MSSLPFSKSSLILVDIGKAYPIAGAISSISEYFYWHQDDFVVKHSCIQMVVKRVFNLTLTLMDYEMKTFGDCT